MGVSEGTGFDSGGAMSRRARASATVVQVGGNARENGLHILGIGGLEHARANFRSPGESFTVPPQMLSHGGKTRRAAERFEVPGVLKRHPEPFLKTERVRGRHSRWPAHLRLRPFFLWENPRIPKTASSD